MHNQQVPDWMLFPYIMACIQISPFTPGQHDLVIPVLGAALKISLWPRHCTLMHSADGAKRVYASRWPSIFSVYVCFSQGGQEEDPSNASPMRQALDRLAQRAWSNRKGPPEPALDRSISSPKLSPRTRSQAFLDPPSPAVIPSAANRHNALAVPSSNRNNVMALNRQGAATGNRRDSATSRDLTGMQSYQPATSLLPACSQPATSLLPASVLQVQQGFLLVCVVHVPVGMSRHTDMGRRNSASNRDTSLTLRPSGSDGSALGSALGSSMTRRSTMQYDSQAAAPGMQQSNRALAVRPGNCQALVPSSAGRELATLDEGEDVPRAEHQLRQKVHACCL